MATPEEFNDDAAGNSARLSGPGRISAKTTKEWVARSMSRYTACRENVLAGTRKCRVVDWVGWVSISPSSTCYRHPQIGCPRAPGVHLLGVSVLSALGGLQGTCGSPRPRVLSPNATLGHVGFAVRSLQIQGIPQEKLSEPCRHSQDSAETHKREVSAVCQSPRGRDPLWRCPAKKGRVELW